MSLWSFNVCIFVVVEEGITIVALEITTVSVVFVVVVVIVVHLE